jgi:type I restriction enzyme, R subunit
MFAGRAAPRGERARPAPSPPHRYRAAAGLCARFGDTECARSAASTGPETAAQRLRELQDIAAGLAATKQEPERFGLTQPGEYGLFTILRAHAPGVPETYVAECARRMVAHLQTKGLLAPGWSNSIGGRMRVEQSILAESWNAQYERLGFDRDAPDPPFLKPAVSELAKWDGLMR